MVQAFHSTDPVPSYTEDYMDDIKDVCVTPSGRQKGIIRDQ